jgi:hypothetical protein
VKNLVLAQITVYLFLSPLAMLLLEDVKSYRFDISVFFLLSFFIGVAFAQTLIARGMSGNYDRFPFIPGAVKLSLMGLALLYIYVVVANGLVIRRQGSENMANLFANLPLIHLAILRIFEILFYPVFFIIMKGLQYDRGGALKLLLAIFLVAFAFTGILDSRAKILLPIFYYYVLFIASESGWKPISNKFLIGIILLGLSSNVVIALIRMDDFGNLFEYIQEDFISRLDGLNLISRVTHEMNISWLGTYDFMLFSNFVAGIPFLEAATALKEAGMTSSKNYLLKEVLGMVQIDHVNTMVTDLYYFGGYFLLIICAMHYGYLVMRLDILVRTNRLWSSRILMAFMFSFLINALRIEVDYFGMWINIFRDFCLLFGMSLTIRFLDIPGQNRLHTPTALSS